MSCFCIPPYSASPDGSECILVTTAETIGSSSTTLSEKSVTNGVFGSLGTMFYEDITNLNLPIINSGNTGAFRTRNGTLMNDTVFWMDSDGIPLNIIVGGPGRGYGSSNNSNISNFYGPPIFPSYNNNTSPWGRSSIGRLNATGIWGDDGGSPITGEWIGYTYCFNLETSGTYYFGIAADDYLRVRLNGQLIVDSYNPTPVTGAYFVYSISILQWSVFPISLTAGPNYLQFEALSTGQPQGLGAEIYSGSLSSITATTTVVALSALTIFSTLDTIGTPIPNVGDLGFTCPEGYVLDSCAPVQYCVRVQKTNCFIPPPPTPTPTPTPSYGYLQTGYVTANECDVVTIFPMTLECFATPISGKTGNSNGSIELSITGGTPPYLITMTNSNGISSIVPQAIYNLPAGTYSFEVVDFFGDFTAATTCTISNPIPESCTCILIFAGNEACGSDYYIKLNPVSIVNGKDYFEGLDPCLISNNIMLSIKYNPTLSRWEFYSNNVLDSFFSSTSNCPLSSSWAVGERYIIYSTTSIDCNDPIPIVYPCFCMKFNIFTCNKLDISSIQFTGSFCPTSDINDYPAWSSSTGNEIIYYDLADSRYEISGSTSSLLGQYPCNTVFNIKAGGSPFNINNLLNPNNWTLINSNTKNTTNFIITNGIC
jgi:hypothetical protein